MQSSQAILSTNGMIKKAARTNKISKPFVVLLKFFMSSHITRIFMSKSTLYSKSFFLLINASWSISPFAYLFLRISSGDSSLGEDEPLPVSAFTR